MVQSTIHRSNLRFSPVFFQATKVFDIFDEDEIRKSVENNLDKLEYVEEDGKKSDPETAIVKAPEKSDAPVAEDTVDATTVDVLNQQQPPTGNKSVVKLKSKYVPSWLEIQSCMTLTDIRLMEYLGLKEKGAKTELSI